MPVEGTADARPRVGPHCNKREEDKCQSPHLCCVNAVAFSNSGVFLYTVCCKLLRRFVSLIKKVQQEISWQ